MGKDAQNYLFFPEITYYDQINSTKMRRLLWTLVVIMATALHTDAVPATGRLYAYFITESGDSLRVRLLGDEHHSFWLSDDGRCFRLTPQQRLREIDREAALSQQMTPATLRRTPALGDFKHYEGKYRGIIILADFDDRHFKEGHDLDLYTHVANTEGFTNEMGFKGSVRDYFLSQSRGKFDFSFDVVGPVQLSHSYKYYGEDAADGSSRNLHAGEMIAEACQLAGEEADWSQYDWDGDGEVEQVFVLFAGEGQHNSTDTYTIWPHKHSLSQSDYGKTLQIGDCIIDQYACSSEMFTATMISGIGVMCHEFSHCFGFPEHYDAAMGSAGNFGMGRWDVMGYGNYNGNGFTPAGYTSYERMVLGWLDPIELKDGEVQIDGMRPLSEDGEAYIIYNDGNPDEYYMLENRQQTGWDEALPGRGLLILHVDFDKKIWEANGVNVVQTGGSFQNDHQRMTIFHADNDDLTTDFSLQRDPYPYSKRDSLTDRSFPPAALYTPNMAGKKLMGKPITRITRNADQTMSFHFSGSGSETGITEWSSPVTDGARKEIYHMGERKVWVIPHPNSIPLPNPPQRGGNPKYIGR